MVGEWQGHSAGAFTLDERALKQIVLNFDAAGLDVPVDYEHQSLYGVEAPAAGWIKHPGGLKVEGETLLARIEWTPRAKERIKAGEYRYLSPTLVSHATDPKSGEDVGWALHSVAMTNTPFFNELPPIAARQTPADGRRSNTNEEDQMTKEQIEALQAENEALKAELDKHRKVAAEHKVEQAIAARKLTPEQKEWGVQYAMKDADGFDAFLKNARPIVQKPDDDLYPASNTPDTAEIPADRL
jgi:phage I-like protein